MPNGRRQVKLPRPQVRRLKGRGDYVPGSQPSQVAGRQADNQIDRIEHKLDRLIKPTQGLGSGVGRLVGSMVGQGDLGAAAGGALSKWLGHGDYNVVTNSLIQGSHPKSSSIPTFTKDGKRGIRVTERDYIGDVFSSSTPGAFQAQTFRVNPADAATFPWLSTLASQFEEWEPLGIVFHYVPTSSSYSGAGSQALGTVIMATDYDPTDPPPTSKLVMEQMDYSQSARPSDSQEHGIECDVRERPTRSYYTSAEAPSEDRRLTDHGNFTIATTGVAVANVNLGELWVSYDIAFYKKQILGGQLGAITNQALFYSRSAPTTGDPCGTAMTRYGTAGNYTFTSNNSGAATFAFPPNIQIGTYSVTYFVIAATSVAIGAGITAGANCVLAPSIVPDPGNSTNFVLSYIGSPNAQVSNMGRAVLRITGPKAVFSISGITITGASSYAFVIVEQCRPSAMVATGF